MGMGVGRGRLICGGGEWEWGRWNEEKPHIACQAALSQRQRQPINTRRRPTHLFIRHIDSLPSPPSPLLPSILLLPISRLQSRGPGRGRRRNRARCAAEARPDNFQGRSERTREGANSAAADVRSQEQERDSLPLSSHNSNHTRGGQSLPVCRESLSLSLWGVLMRHERPSLFLLFPPSNLFEKTTRRKAKMRVCKRRWEP